MDEGAGERVEEADGATGLVAEDEESINDAEAVVGRELRAVDLGACTGAGVDGAAARRGCAVGDRDPLVGAEAGVKPAARQTGVVGALAPGLARGSETKVLGDVDGEKPGCDLLNQLSRQIGPIAPAWIGTRPPNAPFSQTTLGFNPRTAGFAAAAPQLIRSRGCRRCRLRSDARAAARGGISKNRPRSAAGAGARGEISRKFPALRPCPHLPLAAAGA